MYLFIWPRARRQLFLQILWTRGKERLSAFR